MRGVRLITHFFPHRHPGRTAALGRYDHFLAARPGHHSLSPASWAMRQKPWPKRRARALVGLLNATLGNAAELIITIVALSAGKIDLVKASIIGSILGNLLVVLGLSLLLGGLKNGVQRFNRNRVSVDATLVILAAIAISVPSLFAEEIGGDFSGVEALSLTTAVVMLLLYVLGHHSIPCASRRKKSSMRRLSNRRTCRPPLVESAVPSGIMVLAVAGLALMSEFLVGSLDVVTETFGLSEFFVGIILVPLIGNVAEHLVAVQVAIKDQMDLSLSIALGSSLQIALLVAPLLVFISLFARPSNDPGIQPP